MKFEHVPVLLNEVIDGLKIKEDGIYVDATLGGGGHSKYIIEKLTSGKLIGIDQDENAPIFDVAHYCIVGDLYEILPGLLEKVKKEGTLNELSI